MKIIRIPEVYSFANREGALLLHLSEADAILDMAGVLFFGYGSSVWERRVLHFDGVDYRFEFSEPGSTDVSVSALKEGRCQVVSSSGQLLKIAPEILYLLVHASFSDHRGRLINNDTVFGTLLGYPSGSDATLGIANVRTMEIATREGLSLWPDAERLVGDRVVGLNPDWRAGPELVCLNDQLGTIWSFKPDHRVLYHYFVGPEIYQDLTIQSFGHTRLTETPGPIVDGQQCQNVAHFHDGGVYGLSLADGAERWRSDFPNSVDNMELVGDRLLVCSANEIHILDPMTGATERIIDTGLDGEFDRSLYKTSAHVQGDYLYYCHPADACLLIYRVSDFTLVRRLDIPPPYSVDRFRYHHDATGKLYFELRPHFSKVYEHMRPLLEIDPADLQSEIEIDNGPPVEIEIKPAHDNPDHEEIWVTLRDIPLETAVVYGEMHTQDQAYYHGYQGPVLVSIHLNERFNGQVHFRYSGSDRPADEVRKKLAVLEKRFSEWADRSCQAGTDPSKDAVLDAQYVD